MRIGIVGAGALGSVLGGLLTEAGLDPVFIERDKDEVLSVSRNGFWLEGVSGDRTILPKIVWDPHDAGKVDLALVLVKAYDTVGAIPAIESILSTDGAVLTLQNGIGNYETLDKAFTGRVLLGTTTVGAMTLGRGRFRHTGFGQTNIGEADGVVRERTQRIANILAKMNAGPVEVVDNAMGAVWSKLIINAGINAPATLLEIRNGDLPESESGRLLIHEIVEECLEIVRAKKITLTYEDPEERVIGVCKATAGNLNSMFQDVLAGRKTEIDFINGALAEEAGELGIPAPVNRTLALLIKSLEDTAGKRVKM